jgi:hypothetical protein
MIDLTPYIEAYRKEWTRITKLESYKWVAFKHYKEHCTRKFNSEYDRINTIYGKSSNLLASRLYYPLGVLLDMASAEGMPNELAMLFNDLLQEGVLPTKDRVRSFIEGAKNLMKNMAEAGFSDWQCRTNLQTYQEPHSVSVYLSMFYPNDFYIYKYSIFKEFAKIAQVDIVNSNAIERLFEFQHLCKEVKGELLKDKNLIDFYRLWLTDHDFTDENFNLLTQDFIYAVVRHLNSDSFEKIEGKKKRVGVIKVISGSQVNTSTPSHKNRKYKGALGIEYNKIERQNEEIGFSGEMWVVNFEKERLQTLGLSPEKVRHTSYVDGDGCGFDILSVENDGITPRYIEVKTTSGDESQPIFFSDNELNFSIEHKAHYYLYRVYNFKAANKTADLTILNDSLDSLNAVPISYRASLKY